MQIKHPYGKTRPAENEHDDDTAQESDGMCKRECNNSCLILTIIIMYQIQFDFFLFNDIILGTRNL